ncbi:hypothetical protein ANTRET_LOCUS5317 [Anthophora retusa]
MCRPIQILPLYLIFIGEERTLDTISANTIQSSDKRRFSCQIGHYRNNDTNNKNIFARNIYPKRSLSSCARNIFANNTFTIVKYEKSELPRLKGSRRSSHRKERSKKGKKELKSSTTSSGKKRTTHVFSNYNTKYPRGSEG